MRLSWSIGLRSQISRDSAACPPFLRSGPLDAAQVGRLTFVYWEGQQRLAVEFNELEDLRAVVGRGPLVAVISERASASAEARSCRD